MKIVNSRKYFFLYLSIIVYFSCNKNPDFPFHDSIEQKFFTTSNNTHQIVKSLSQKISQQNEQYHFVRSLVKRIGFPYWDRSILSSTKQNNFRGEGGLDTTLIYIPFIKETSNTVNSILLIRLS